MAQPYSTGPCGAFLGIGPNGLGAAPIFLGHSESGFRIVTTHEYEHLMNDLTGSRIPLEKQNMGAHAHISGVLTRWNDRVWQLLEARMGAGVRGAEPFGVDGAFMALEGYSCTLWLAFPYSLKAFMRNAVNGTLESGRRYPFACVDQDVMDPVGTRALKRHISFHCLRQFFPATGGKVLFDNNMAGLPAID